MSHLESCDRREGGLNAFLETFSQLPVGFVVLAGENGTGKTYLARCVLEDYFNSRNRDVNFQPIYVTQKKIMDKMAIHRQTYGHTLDLQYQLVETPLLLLDDIGTRKPTEALGDFLYAVVDERWRKRKKLGTIVTTNLNANQLRQQFGDAFVSRVASGQCFRLEGGDRRLTDTITN